MTRARIFTIGLLVLLACAAGFAQGAALTLLGQFLATWVACRAWQMLAAEAGLYSFGHAVFVGAGAYAALWALRACAGLHPAWVALLPLAAAGAGAAAAAVCGLFAARSRGTAFAMISFGLGELVHLLAQALPAVFGGEAGVGADRGLGHFSSGGLDFAAPWQLHLLLVAWAALAFVALAGLEHSAFVRALRLVRDQPARAEALGLVPARMRWQAMVLSGALAGVAGAMLALQFELASAELFGAQRSLGLMIAVLVGGVAAPAGAALGAAVQVGFAQGFALHFASWQLVYGLLFLLLMLWRPDGLAALWPRRGRAQP